MYSWLKLFAGIIFWSLSSASLAAHYLIVPTCLTIPTASNKTLAHTQNLRLIAVKDLKTIQTAKQMSYAACRGFIDVTQAFKDWLAVAKSESSTVTPQIDLQQFLENYLPDSHPSDFTRHYKIQYQKQVKSLLQKIDKPEMYADYLSFSGKQGSMWLKQKLKSYIGTTENISLFNVPTINNFMQASIILRLGEPSGEAIILGTDFDNKNVTGTITLLETARLLITSGLTFKKPIYFIWYAGSEIGRLGSQSVVSFFNKEQIAVDAVLQLGQTGYKYNTDSEIGLSDDATDAALNVFIADLAATYIKLPIGVVHCGFACSDHAIWYQNGNRVSYPTATMREENPYARAKKDTLDNLSLDQMSDFVKLSLAFAVELAGPL